MNILTSTSKQLTYDRILLVVGAVEVPAWGLPWAVEPPALGLPSWALSASDLPLLPPDPWTAAPFLFSALLASNAATIPSINTEINYSTISFHILTFQTTCAKRFRYKFYYLAPLTNCTQRILTNNICRFTLVCHTSALQNLSEVMPHVDIGPDIHRFILAYKFQLFIFNDHNSRRINNNPYCRDLQVSIRLLE
jgi:hypothetical protein